MHLRSITLKGFKSFPDRARLEFAPGISVVVGPNGSGKSNITDAVLWALGEQSPLAVRGQSMQDVIFGGGRGVQARSSAEVEIVIDNSDGAVDLPMSEISIQRRLDRSGEGEYRLNGARCRLVDVLETLSDTGLGKEMHSVVSQGRVEAIVTSKPRDRRLLIEEAAGLGKHRKRRRRAQLKLDRTVENLDRALDVEREARSRLRPLKRQAEAAELHERLERQAREARWELLRDDLRLRCRELETAQEAVRESRAGLAGAEQEMAAIAARREQAEHALAQRAQQREALARKSYSARSACERIELRRERVTAVTEALAGRVTSRSALLTELGERLAGVGDDGGARARLTAHETELRALDAQREHDLERELAELAIARGAAATALEHRQAGLEQAALAAETARRACDAARDGLRKAERTVEQARRDAASVGAELAAANQFLRANAGVAVGGRALSGELQVREGCELAISAALGGRLGAAVVGSRSEAGALLDRAPDDGGRVLVTGGPGSAAPQTAGPPPVAGATALSELIAGSPDALALARRLLSNAWLVDDVEQLDKGFEGIAVTRAGRAWFGATRELRQVAEGGAERVLAERNRRARLIEDSERAAGVEQAARAALQLASEELRDAESRLDVEQAVHREAQRAHAAGAEELRRADLLAEQRRAEPDHGERAVRRAQLEGEMAAERGALERAERERTEIAQRIEALAAGVVADRALEQPAQRLSAVLGELGEGARVLAASFDDELGVDARAGEALAEALRTAAAEEAALHARLRDLAEVVTTAEVRAAQARDRDAEVRAELAELARALELDPAPTAEPLGEDRRTALEVRVGRLARRREQLGPVNPLAAGEYAEALAHVEELEEQRTDLETALRELRSVIRETDREIREKFEATLEATARNFEELVGDVFPGGRGRLRLVTDDSGPRSVLGGGGADVGADRGAAGALGGGEPTGEESEEAAQAEVDAAAPGTSPDELLGVEIEVTPAGKAMKRLSLLSGGEKSMTAIAFLFAVFLARPCPFYILDEVEAALDDVNISRFLDLLRRHSDRAQFIVVTHQKRTMEAADCLYGVSMGNDGVSKVISRRLPPDLAVADEHAADAA